MIAFFACNDLVIIFFFILIFFNWLQHAQVDFPVNFTQIPTGIGL